MNFKETKFAYRHKPTGKWVRLYTGFFDNKPYMDFHHEKFHPEMLSNKKPIKKDLLRSTMNGERYAAQNFLEFELVEVEVEYKIKQSGACKNPNTL
jgi:hypothetical protein